MRPVRNPAGRTRFNVHIELKPCPFCGSRSVGLWLGPAPHVTCVRCGADGPAFERESSSECAELLQDTALRAWNERTREKETT